MLRVSRPIPFLDLAFTLRVNGALPDAAFLGPTVRGLLGYGLRATCCGHESSGGGGCDLGEACVFSYLFDGAISSRLAARHPELDALPKPFVVRFNPAARSLSHSDLEFSIRLIGDAIALAPHVAEAVLARESSGFGARSSHYTTQSIAVNGNSVWFRDRGIRHESVSESIRPYIAPRCFPCFELPVDCSSLRFRFDAPTALDFDQDFAALAPALLKSIGTRARLLSLGYTSCLHVPTGCTYVDPRAFKTLSTDLRSIRIDRRSTRHGERVVLDGFVGSAVIAGPWHEHLCAIENMAAFGVGHHTSFGFGDVSFECVAQPQGTLPLHRAKGRIVAAHRSLPRWIQLRGERLRK